METVLDIHCFNSRTIPAKVRKALLLKVLFLSSWNDMLRGNVGKIRKYNGGREEFYAHILSRALRGLT